MGVNNFINQKMLMAQGKLQEKADNFIKNKLPKTTLKQDCQSVLKLRKVVGVACMRQQVLDGFETEWAVQKTVEETLQPYRDEPLFAAVMDRLHITWTELEELARKVVTE